MQRIAHIINGKIANVSLLAEGKAIPEGAMLESDAIAAGIGRANSAVVDHAAAQMWQVKVWLARNKISLASINQIIESQIPAGPEREEALIRWEYATEVPFSNPLVGMVAAGLGIDKTTAWQEILAI